MQDNPIGIDANLAPALLADASWYGTLAAARDLGAHGVRVTLATDDKLAPACWSRYVARSVPAPSTRARVALLEWLRRFARQVEKHVLHPTSDDLAWLVAANAEELGGIYHLVCPPLSALCKLLDKAELAKRAQRAGLDTPETRVPASEDEVVKCAKELGYPLFIKPRAQLFSSRLTKGVRVTRADELSACWRSVRRDVVHDPEVVEHIPGVALPVVQSCSEQSERIYTVNGYFDHERGFHPSIACVKLLQRPRGSGAGIVFEEVDVDSDIHASLGALFRDAGFFGVYDAEFLEVGSRRMLIDINPRFYNHMAFEVERGLHLPWLAHLAASGEHEALRAAVAAYTRPRSNGRAYVHRLPTAMLLFAQSVSSGMTMDERRRWRNFITAHRLSTTNPARTPEDPRPEIVEVAMELRAFLRHPRAYLRSLTRAPTSR